MRPAYGLKLKLGRGAPVQTIQGDVLQLSTRCIRHQRRDCQVQLANSPLWRRLFVTSSRLNLAEGGPRVEKPPEVAREPGSETSKSRIQTSVDPIIRVASSLSRQLNIYTGTDYTPIQELRGRITEQENSLKILSVGLNTAKGKQDAALNERTASQKELLRLLERKSSWTDADLERYMSLVRDEHITDQKVSETRMRLEQAEKEVEESRGSLERLERRLYHEEQVWSDTIRRNSTWVTFGLMGVNVLLLVVGLIVIEPWRRRRLVSEISQMIESDETVLRQSSSKEAILPDEVKVQVEEATNELVLPTASFPSTATFKQEEEESTSLSNVKAFSLDNLRNISLADMTSQQAIQLSMRDLSIFIATGATVGATFSWVIGSVLRSR